MLYMIFFPFPEENLREKSYTTFAGLIAGTRHEKEEFDHVINVTNK
jgi:hypothetical protein